MASMRLQFWQRVEVKRKLKILKYTRKQLLEEVKELDDQISKQSEKLAEIEEFIRESNLPSP